MPELRNQVSPKLPGFWVGFVPWICLPKGSGIILLHFWPLANDLTWRSPLFPDYSFSAHPLFASSILLILLRTCPSVFLLNFSRFYQNMTTDLPAIHFTCWQYRLPVLFFPRTMSLSELTLLLHRLPRCPTGLSINRLGRRLFNFTAHLLSQSRYRWILKQLYHRRLL